jgi:hypothetical protein
MKPLLASLLVFAGLPLCAQTSSTTTTTSDSTTTTAAPPAPPSSNSMMDQVTATLTPAEKTQLSNVRIKTMQDNPDLQKEELALMQKGMAMQSGGEITDADKMAFHDEIKSHADKVRAAMIKEDPTVEPIMLKVEAQITKLRAEHAAAQ